VPGRFWRNCRQRFAQRLRVPGEILLHAPLYKFTCTLIAVSVTRVDISLSLLSVAAGAPVCPCCCPGAPLTYKLDSTASIGIQRQGIHHLHPSLHTTTIPNQA
jgi:hypothetical protein